MQHIYAYSGCLYIETPPSLSLYPPLIYGLYYYYIYTYTPVSIYILWVLPAVCVYEKEEKKKAHNTLFALFSTSAPPSVIYSV